MKNINNSDLIDDIKSEFLVIEKLIKHSIPQSKILKIEDWSKMEKNYIAKIEPVVMQQKHQSGCLIDYIMASKHPDPFQAEPYIFMIECINDQIEKALKIVNSTPKFQNVVENIIRSMIISMDTNINSTNSDFKNWINELFVLNKLASDDTHTLIDLERKLPNNKSVDYVLSHNETKVEMLIDATTIQNVNIPKLKTESKINRFLNNKIKNKYKKKMKNLSGDYNFFVLPVIEYQEGMENFKVKVNKNISRNALTVHPSIIEGKMQCIISDTNIYLSNILKERLYLESQILARKFGL